MTWIFAGFLIASILHMVEEYFFPGGFMTVMKRMNPDFAPFVNVPMAVVINGLQLVLCIIVIFVGRSNLAFSLSAASLLFINGLAHLGGSIRLKGYVPGVVTGSVLYLPLSIYAFYYFTASGELNVLDTVTAAWLGMLYQIVPLVYFLVMKLLSRRNQG
ncbi:MAG: HXXEE domain-containing protein [Chloroflexi bacterium]|nr:HXXEE domain-containing protein [Chloroflexota bacterium]